MKFISIFYKFKFVFCRWSFNWLFVQFVSDLSSPLVKQRLVRCLLISLIVVIFCGKALL